MSFLAKGKKEDLKLLASELHEEVLPGMTMVDIKKLITGSKEYEKDFVKGLLYNIIETRLERRKEEMEELRRKEMEELKRKEMEELKRKEEMEELRRKEDRKSVV